MYIYFIYMSIPNISDMYVHMYTCVYMQVHTYKQIPPHIHTRTHMCIRVCKCVKQRETLMVSQYFLLSYQIMNE